MRAGRGLRRVDGAAGLWFGGFRDLGSTAARRGVAGNGALATAGTVLCGVFVQALPFLGLGVLVSGLIAVFVAPERLVRWLPHRPESAVLAAGLAGAALPGCECGSVPVARRLFGDGGAAGAASGVDVYACRSGH